MSVRIARINHPPTVGKAIPEQKAIQDQDFTFTFGRDTFKEQDDGDTLAYDAVQKDGTPLPSWLHFARSDRTFEGVPRDSDVGTLVVTVTAMDKAGRHREHRLRAQGRQRRRPADAGQPASRTRSWTRTRHCSFTLSRGHVH